MSKTFQQPWEVFPDIWKTKAAFFSYLRGGLRMIWSRYPAKLEWKKKQLTPERPPGYTGRGKSFGKCHYCGCMFTGSALEVDHVEQVGSCNSWETAGHFMENLLDCNDNWVLACKPCHKVKSHAEKTGASFEEAAIQKRVIAMTKNSKDFVVDFCKKNGYNADQLTNSEKRKAALTEIFTKELQ